MTFAIVGCGDIAEAEWEAIDHAEAAEVGLVMDSRLDHARRLGRRLGIEATDSYEKVLESDVDAVVLAVPHHLHRDLAVRAARAGKHVVLEKPIATTPADGRAIAAACAEADVRLAVAYVQRFRPSNLVAADMVHRGAIGRVLRAQATDLFRKPESYWTDGYSGSVSTDWRASREKSGGGVFMMNVGHSLDSVMSITGLQPVSVYAVAANRATPGVEVEDDITAVFSCVGGAIAVFQASTVVAGDPTAEEVICGSRGTIRLGCPLNVYLDEPWGAVPAGRWIAVPVEEVDPWQDGRDAFFREFVRSVREGTAPPIGGEEALRTLELINAGYLSAATGTVVHL